MSDEEKRMTFTEHLGELRTRIIRSCIAVLVTVVGCYIFSEGILNLLAWPLMPEAQQTVGQVGVEGAAAVQETKRAAPNFVVLNPIEIVLLKLKMAGYGGFLLALPYLLWQICAFVFPGLRPSEQRTIQVLIIGCSILAVVGVLVSYFGVLPLVLPMLLQWVPEGWEAQLRASETISIIIKFLVGFAVAFQFPMAVLILVYMGLLTPATLKQYRRVAIVGMAVGAAAFTPPDPVSMVIMLLPLVLLYEGSVLLSYVVVRRKSKTSQTSS